MREKLLGVDLFLPRPHRPSLSLWIDQTLPEIIKVRVGLPGVNDRVPGKAPGTPAAPAGMPPGKRAFLCPQVSHDLSFILPPLVILYFLLPAILSFNPFLSVTLIFTSSAVW